MTVSKGEDNKRRGCHVMYNRLRGERKDGVDYELSAVLSLETSAELVAYGIMSVIVVKTAIVADVSEYRVNNHGVCYNVKPFRASTKLATG